jgi:Fe-S-cluster containining protein
MHDMNAPYLTPLVLTDVFQFDCHPRVPCFNQCCRDLNQALTPYDVLRLKISLKLTSDQLLARYIAVHMGPATGLPVAAMRFDENADRACPFVSAEGCRVYDHRPASCRLYPLARVMHRSRSDGALTEHYALLKEPHCCGFGETQSVTVAQWIKNQGLEGYLSMNDALLDLISMKNQSLPGPLPPELAQMTRMVFYDVDGLKKRAKAGVLKDVDGPSLFPLPDMEDDHQWLHWGLDWIRQQLFGTRQ